MTKPRLGEYASKDRTLKQTSLRVEKWLYDKFLVMIGELNMSFNEAVVKLMEIETKLYERDKVGKENKKDTRKATKPKKEKSAKKQNQKKQKNK